MPVLSDKPGASKFQVGENICFLESNLLRTGVIKIVETIINNPQNDSNGKQTNMYYVADSIVPLTEDKIFSNSNLLFKSLKGDYVSDLSGVSFGTSDISGKNFSGFNLSGVDLSEVTNIENLDVRGANLESAVLHESINSKEQFIMATGFYDNDTIWTDGTMITEE